MQSFPDFVGGEAVERLHDEQTPVSTRRAACTPPRGENPRGAERKAAARGAYGPAHREVGPGGDGWCKRACPISVRSAPLENLPGATARKGAGGDHKRGRLPYPVLTIAVAFLVFFTVLYLAKWAMRAVRERCLNHDHGAFGGSRGFPAVGAAAAAVARWWVRTCSLWRRTPRVESMMRV